jgi:predicted aspartyl protease
MTAIATRYQHFLSPAAPFAIVAVEDLSGSAQVANCPAHIDTAADWTVLPQSVVDQLGIVPNRTIQLMGFGGVPANYPVFEVRLTLPTFKPIVLEVTAHKDEHWVLLGRDVLNRYKTTLDGPGQMLTIEEP